MEKTPGPKKTRVMTITAAEAGTYTLVSTKKVLGVCLLGGVANGMVFLMVTDIASRYL